MAVERLGESQKSALKYLLALQLRGVMRIEMSKLLFLINKSRLNPLHRNNFRIAIKRLEDVNLIQRGLNRSLTWNIALTDQGKTKADKLLTADLQQEIKQHE